MKRTPKLCHQRVTALLFCLGISLPAMAQDAFLSAGETENRITPLAELMEPVDSQLTAPLPTASLQAEQVDSEEENGGASKASPKSRPSLREETPAPRLEKHPETPTSGENKTENKTEKPLDFWASINPFRNEKAPPTVNYAPLPGIAVFAVVKHGNEKAFSDLPLMFAREYAIRLEAKAPETRILNPVATEAAIRAKGLGYLYDQVVQDYMRMGRPEPVTLGYLLKQLEGVGPGISRVVFVEADLDMSHPDASTGLLERAKKLMTDGMPQERKYFIGSRLQAFDAEKPEFPMVWASSWRRSIPVSRFFNVTPSVFSENDSQQAFAAACREMSRELLYVTPKIVYMAPVYDTSVQGKLVSPQP